MNSEKALLFVTVVVAAFPILPAAAQATSSGSKDFLIQLLPLVLVGAVIWFLAKKGRGVSNASSSSSSDDSLRSKAEAYANEYYTFFIPGFAGYISAGRPDLVPKVFMDNVMQGKNYSEAAKAYIIHEYMRTGRKPKW